MNFYISLFISFVVGMWVMLFLMEYLLHKRYKQVLKEVYEKINSLPPNERQIYLNRLNQISSLYISEKNLNNLYRVEKEVENIIYEIDNKKEEINLEVTNNPLDKLNKELMKYKNEEKGRNFEIFVGKYFENLGYKIYYNGIINGRRDEGIDLIAYNKDMVLLIQCKNWKENSKYKITDKNLKEFIGNCYTFIKNNPKIMNKKIKRLYITSCDVFSDSANYFIEKNKELIEKKILKFD
ncbi:restriction endonuclease [Caminibacter mediatlanticus]|uniref:Restriction endonuclease type IV Mrr domain-containing protein n=2 Tax=Caminibacter mediatlanticus TB-2 TaxID=391592 RepID=A0AAI9AJ08_9BACT|nr:restriction endonuclease [Caminibacter mediatlanticus]EDM24397.1 hypothetical protein CMTB2_02738 [Caminibacter mediatlanticus TB-2]